MRIAIIFLYVLECMLARGTTTDDDSDRVDKIKLNDVVMAVLLTNMLHTNVKRCTYLCPFFDGLIYSDTILGQKSCYRLRPVYFSAHCTQPESGSAP